MLFKDKINKIICGYKISTNDFRLAIRRPFLIMKGMKFCNSPHQPLRGVHVKSQTTFKMECGKSTYGGEEVV